MPGEALSAPPAPVETYQPLSLLAMAGFGLAVVYTLLVLVGGLMSLMGHKPWLMPYWTFFIPIGVLIVCKLARTRIEDSEGTLTGSGFATWGSRLAILFSFTYAAYYFATFLAVRSPAIECANDFFQKIKTDQLAELFLMSKDIPIPTKDRNLLRAQVESRFNQPSAGPSAMPGDFTRFGLERFVRFIQMDGDEAKIVPMGVALWEYGKGGYHLILSYHVATSLVEFDMKVETVGDDPKPSEGKGRRWRVLLVGSETKILPESLKRTERGTEFEQRTFKANEFANELAAKISDVQAMKPAERESYAKRLRGLDTFWSSNNKLHVKIAERIRNTFQESGGGKSPPINLKLLSIGVPLMRESDGRTTAWVDVSISYYDESGSMPQYSVDARLAISAGNSEAAKSPRAWRLDAIEIESGRTSPEMRRMMQRMPGPTIEEAGGEGLQRIRPQGGPPPLPGAAGAPGPTPP